MIDLLALEFMSDQYHFVLLLVLELPEVNLVQFATSVWDSRLPVIKDQKIQALVTAVIVYAYISVETSSSQVCSGLVTFHLHHTRSLHALLLIT